MDPAHIRAMAEMSWCDERKVYEALIEIAAQLSEVTLRDRFAMAAMQIDAVTVSHKLPYAQQRLEAAKAYYAMADAMLEARKL